MLNVEAAIAEVASVYQSLTGQPIKPGRYELPPEVDPLGQAEQSYRQMKSMLGDKARGGGGEARARPEPKVAPPADVLELEREVRVMIDVPGVTREHLAVVISADALTIRGERAMPRQGVGVLRLAERPKGAILRTIALPPRARRDGIEATLRDGVLTISIPTDGSEVDTTEIPIDVK